MNYTEKELNEIFKEARLAKTFSDDAETQVGAVVKINISGKDSFLKAANTFVNGANKNSLPRTRPDKYEFMVHAEQNLIYKSFKMGLSLINSTVFCTLSPCQACIRALWQSGVKEIYFEELYRYHDISMKDLKVSQTKVGKYYHLKIENYE